MTYLYINENLQNASTYVRYADEVPAAILVFNIVKKKICVLNESICLPSEEIQLFTNEIFLRYKNIDVVSFHAIETNDHNFSAPYQLYPYLSDMWMPTPTSPEAYLKSLDPRTRQNIGRSLRNIQKHFRSFAYDVLEKDDVCELTIRKIIAFNRARLFSKGEVSSVNEPELQRIVAITRESGLVGIATINGHICGGQICYRFGTNFVFRATGHDTAYDSYGLGFLGTYMIFCACIERGAKSINMGWGTLGYKFKLGGIQRNLKNLLVFRSKMSYVLNVRLIAKSSIDAAARRLRHFIKRSSQAEGGASAVSMWLINRMRTLRKLKTSLCNRSV